MPLDCYFSITQVMDTPSLQEFLLKVASCRPIFGNNSCFGSSSIYNTGHLSIIREFCNFVSHTCITLYLSRTCILGCVILKCYDAAKFRFLKQLCYDTKCPVFNCFEKTTSVWWYSECILCFDQRRTRIIVKTESKYNFCPIFRIGS